jgi:hypothetical protein
VQIDPMTSLEENWSPLGTGTAGLLLNTPGRNGQAIGDGRIASTPLLGVMGTTSYNSFQARTQGRFADLTLSMGYTFSKNLGFITPGGVTGGAAMPWLYRTYDYGPLTTDISHNLEATAIYELPFGKGKHWLTSGMSANILGGWQISGLMSDFTGRPFSVVANQNLNANGSSQRANCLGEPIQSKTLLHWYDPSTFAAPSGLSTWTSASKRNSSFGKDGILRSRRKCSTSGIRPTMRAPATTVPPVLPVPTTSKIARS